MSNLWLVIILTGFIMSGAVWIILLGGYDE